METRFETENGNVQDVQVSLTLQYLAPWVEKTDGLESIGAWENNLATKMMVKLLELWITTESTITHWIVLRWLMHWWCMCLLVRNCTLRVLWLPSTTKGSAKC